MYASILHCYLCAFHLQNSETYNHLIRQCHLRSAQAMVSGSLLNGGLYIKFCQGLAAMNHILPEEYTKTLIVLQDQVCIQLNIIQ